MNRKMSAAEKAEWEARIMASVDTEKLEQVCEGPAIVEGAHAAPDGSIWIEVFNTTTCRPEEVSYSLVE